MMTMNSVLIVATLVQGATAFNGIQHVTTRTSCLYSTRYREVVTAPPSIAYPQQQQEVAAVALQINRNDELKAPPSQQQQQQVQQQQQQQQGQQTTTYSYGQYTDLRTSTTSTSGTYMPSLTTYSPSYDEQRNNFIHQPFGSSNSISNANYANTRTGNYQDTLTQARLSSSSSSPPPSYGQVGSSTTDTLGAGGMYSNTYTDRRNTFIGNTPTNMNEQRQLTTSDSLNRLYFPNHDGIKPTMSTNLKSKAQMIDTSVSTSSKVHPTIPPGRISPGGDTAWWLGPEAKGPHSTAEKANGYIRSYLKEGDKLSVTHAPPGHVEDPTLKKTKK